MNKVLPILGTGIGIAAVAAGVIYMNIAGSTQASSAQAAVSFAPGELQVNPGEEFDVTMNITTNAGATGAGFSAAAFTLRYDLENAGVVDLPGDGANIVQVSASNMTATIKELEQGRDENGKYARFAISVPLEQQVSLQKTASVKLRFRSLAEGRTTIKLDPEQSEIVGETGESSPLFSWNTSNGTLSVTSGNPQETEPYTASASVAKPEVNPGEIAAITARVTSRQATTALVDIEIYDENNKKIYQDFKQNVELPANQAQNVTVNWSVPSDSFGTYTVKVGVFTNDWSTLHVWNDNAASFSVLPPITHGPEPTEIPVTRPPVSPTSVPTASTAPSAPPTSIPTQPPDNTSPVPSSPGIGYNLNGSAVTFDGISWNGMNGSNITTVGSGFNSPWLLPNLPSNASQEEKNKYSVVTTGISGGGNQPRVEINGVNNGTYDVYLYLIEDDGPQSFDVYLQGSLAANNQSTGAARSWKKIGPFRTEVVNGTLQVQTTRGWVLLSGIALYPANTQPAEPTQAATATPAPTSTPRPSNTSAPTATRTPTAVASTNTPVPSQTECKQLPIQSPAANIRSRVIVYASGTPAGGEYPRIAVTLNGIKTLPNGFVVPPGITSSSPLYNPQVECLATGRQFAAFTYDSTQLISANQVRVGFTNDAVINRQDRNMRIDRIDIVQYENGQVTGTSTYQSEDRLTYSTGTYSSRNGCGAGKKQSEWLHCNGYLEYRLK